MKSNSIGMLALILTCTFSSMAIAGANGGPKSGRNTVGGNSESSHSIVFNGKEKAGILVQGNGDTNFDCAVFDNSGMLIVVDSSPEDSCDLTWVPERTGTFRLVVKNRGNVPNEYVIQTN
jgi:hypothetical protein